MTETQFMYPSVEMLMEVNQELSRAAHEQQMLALKWQGIAKALYTSITDPDDPIFGCMKCALSSYERAVNGE